MFALLNNRFKGHAKSLSWSFCLCVLLTFSENADASDGGLMIMILFIRFPRFKKNNVKRAFVLDIQSSNEMVNMLAAALKKALTKEQKGDAGGL